MASGKDGLHDNEVSNDQKVYTTGTPDNHGADGGTSLPSWSIGDGKKKNDG